jgi:hypothetical protein
MEWYKGENMIKVLVDCSTGISTEVPLTEAEIAEVEASAVSAAARIAEENAAIAAAESARESARAKLAVLGLTEAEVAALVK